MSGQLNVPDVSDSTASSENPGSATARNLVLKWSLADAQAVATMLAAVASMLVALVAVISVVGLNNQLKISTGNSRVAMRSELYQTENGFFETEGADTSAALSSLWARVPPQISGPDYAIGLLRLITSDSAALAAQNAEALYHAAFDISALADSNRRGATSELRRTFLQVQSMVYHVQNAFDFENDEVLTYDEWLTWKGIIGEMNAHPVLMMVIWHGYQNRYLSQEFGVFLRDELCNRSPYGHEHSTRNCTFAKYFYPGMFEDDWSFVLASY